MRQPKINAPALPYPTSTADVYSSMLGPDPYAVDPNILTTPKNRKPSSRPAQRTLIGGDLYA